MTTITINTYDPEARFDMSTEEAKSFFAFVESRAKASGFDVKYDSCSFVDEESERFVEKCFEDY
ncbi:hypothetical protein [Klebsiella michiganensis]|uniref:hypothetical protein n=1 Tax=Klebsiella michiganensis TaxID=1134687 RepID=UPI001CCFDF35|nr:hypothetical protein [Klebsiella michiganensis]MBZ6561987.1 hypothetical protein [Klebsiella michiganensis]MEB8292381.1 hypothetical protein [Klebsiella michiganensis]